MDLREALLREIEHGQGVHAAYRAVSEQLAAAIESGVERGLPAASVLENAGLPVDTGVLTRLGVTHEPFDRALVYIVISDGGVGDVPSAACVAERLRGKPNPSREDIQAAFAACRGR